MARPASIDDKTLIKYVDEYISVYPNKKIKYVDVEAFIQKQGIDIISGIIKRRKAVVDYIKSINNNNLEDCVNKIFAYVPLDITILSNKTHLTVQAKELLINREKTIKQIVESAVAISEENKRLTELNKVLTSENKALKNQIKELDIKKETLLSNKEKIKYYKTQLEGICLPEAFDIIVNNLEYGEVVSKTNLDNKTLTADKPINSIITDITDSLMEGFDDDDII